MPVALGTVKDSRPPPGLVGRHRDGLLRVTQWEWELKPPLVVAARGMLEHALRGAGATLVTAADPSRLLFDLEVLEADVTDDELLAGEETFGQVQVRLVVTSIDGTVVSDRVETLDFADPTIADPGLLGDALYRVVVRAVDGVSLAAPPDAPSSQAGSPAPSS